MRIDKEKCEDLAMATFGRVCKSERSHAMLEDIWKAEKTPLAGLDTAQQLSDVAFIVTIHVRSEAKDLLKKPVPGLFVFNVTDIARTGSLTECESALCDILAIVVVDSCSTDMFILSIIRMSLVDSRP
jgi:hypothetical protein